MFGLIKKNFIRLLIGFVNKSNHTKCVFSRNQKCMIQPTLICLHPNHYSQELHYYLFAVKFDRCIGSCNTLNDLSNKACAPNKTKHLNIHAFNMIPGKRESKVLTKEISCVCKCKFDSRKCNSNQQWNNNK